MFTRTTSIRGKIAAGFVLSFGFLLLLAAVMFVSLRVVEDEVAAYAASARFLDTTLEMRRYEKNYLLYGSREDLERALEYAGAAVALAAEDGGASGHPRWLRVVAGLGSVGDPPDWGRERTVRLLGEYRATLTAAAERGGAARAESIQTAAAIRDLGRGITDVAERVSTLAGRNVQELLRAGRRTLVVLVCLFLVGTALLARVIVLTAMRPLEELERGMQRIAAGEVAPLPEAGPAEIRSMNAAFNRMLREVLERRQEVLQSERLASLGTALAGIAHELNNPLSNVSTSAEILKEENERADARERRELIDQIVSQTDRATEIIRTVLDFTRTPRPDGRRATSLLQAVRGALILVHARLPPHVAVDVDVPSDLEVAADKTRLEQAFVNLLTNAMDALADAGRGGTIRVGAVRREKDVELVFRDNGRGMPREVLDRIFDPFFTTKDVGHGTGLGLYLTHQIVEQHGGTVRVESAPGEGTAVHLSLPLWAVSPVHSAPGGGAEALRRPA